MVVLREGRVVRIGQVGVPARLAVVDFLEATVATRVHGNATGSLEDVPHIVLLLDLRHVQLERVGIHIRGLARI